MTKQEKKFDELIDTLIMYDLIDFYDPDIFMIRLHVFPEIDEDSVFRIIDQITSKYKKVLIGQYGSIVEYQLNDVEL